MKAVISVVGKDRPGILAFVSSECASRNINIVDVTQKVIDDYFTMIKFVEIGNDEVFANFVKDMEVKGDAERLKIHVMHEDIFNAMHSV